jgi:hypothetical protein
MGYTTFLKFYLDLMSAYMSKIDMLTKAPFHMNITNYFAKNVQFPAAHNLKNPPTYFKNCSANIEKAR